MTYLAASISEYLIQANIVLTICILIILAIRFIMRKYSKVFSCYSWGIAAFGLLYFTIRPLHSPVNAIYTFFADRQWRDFGQAGTGDQEAGSMSFIENSGSDDYGYLENPGIFYESGQFLRNLSRTADERSGVSFLEIFFIVWLIGTLLLLIRYFYQYFKVTRRTRFAVRLQDNIFELDGCKTPFVHGIFRTRIYIPYGLSEAERSFIVTHEQCHIRHRDHLILLTVKLLVILFWMNPAGWIAYRKIRLDIEMRCDEYATEKLNAAEKRESQYGAVGKERQDGGFFLSRCGAEEKDQEHRAGTETKSDIARLYHDNMRIVPVGKHRGSGRTGKYPFLPADGRIVRSCRL